MGTLLCSCVKMHEVIKLPFLVVSGVGSGICVIDGVHILQGKEVWEIFWPLVCMAFLSVTEKHIRLELVAHFIQSTLMVIFSTLLFLTLYFLVVTLPW